MLEDFSPELFAKQPVVTETFEARTKRYLDLFYLDGHHLKQLTEDIKADIHRTKLYFHTRQDFPGTCGCLDTCVNDLPDGSERGIFYAVDFGGTNIRCVRSVLHGDTTFSLDSLSREARAIEIPSLAKGLLDRKATATQLFDIIARLMLELMTKHGDYAPDKKTPTNPFYVGFTFSFEIQQTALATAHCTNMSKGWETGKDTIDPVIGTHVDIGLLLNHAFERNGVPAKAVAILNDTTGTLLAGAYGCPIHGPPAQLGVILGTGFNVCYVDQNSHAYGYVGSIINTEMGGYAHKLPSTIIDHEINAASTPRNTHLLEKMISGLYIPELCRRLILRVYRSEAPQTAWCHHSLTTTACFAIAYDKSTELSTVRRVLNEQLDWPVESLTLDRLQAVSDLSRCVIQRSAALTACCISAVAQLTGRLSPAAGGITVAVDGSVYTKNPPYPIEIRKYLREILGDELAALIGFHETADGSGIGAALLAAAVESEEKKSRKAVHSA